MVRYSDKENMVMILTRKHTTLEIKEDGRPIRIIEIKDIWPVLKIAMANSDVVILKEDDEFVVLQHKFMRVVGEVYHISQMRNIIFARK